MTTTTPTLSDLAREVSESFETGTRPDGETFRRLRDGSPEWMTDVVRAGHGTDPDGSPTFLPDDWRYRAVEAACDEVADSDAETADDISRGDFEHDYADGMVDVYTSERLAWLSSSLMRLGYCDEAVEQGLGDAELDLADRIGLGQYVEAREVFSAVVGALDERREALADEDSER